MTHKKEKEKKKGTGLKYIPVIDFLLIPRYLIEQVEPQNFNVDHIYAMSAEIVSSPFNILGVFANQEHEVKGFMWATINPLDMKIHVHMLSIDKEYQGRGIISEATGILRKILERHGLCGIIFRTVKPELFEKNGYRRSEVVIMEGE